MCSVMLKARLLLLRVTLSLLLPESGGRESQKHQLRRQTESSFSSKAFQTSLKASKKQAKSSWPGAPPAVSPLAPAPPAAGS